MTCSPCWEDAAEEDDVAPGPVLFSSSKLQNTSSMAKIVKQHQEKISPVFTPQTSHGKGKTSEHCSVSKGFLSNTGKMPLQP